MSDEIQKLEKQLQALRFDEHEKRRRIARSKMDAFTNEFKIEVYSSDDYAGLETDTMSFYYGYEETVCPNHKQCDDECEDREWAFVVASKSKDCKEIMRIPSSKVFPVEVSCEKYLLAGIGHWVRNKYGTEKT